MSKDYRIIYGNPLTGGDYKLLYGNRDKADEASEKAIFLFNDPISRKQLENVSIISQNEIIEYFLAGTTVSTSGTYLIESEIEQDKFSYLWNIVSGDGTIVSADDEASVIVQTSETSANSTFEIACKIINDMSEIANITETFTHQKISVYPIVINSLTESTSGSCEYPAAGTCVATSTYTISSTETEIYLWEVSNGATIVSGQGSATISVTTDSNANTTFNVKCTVSNPCDSQSINADYTHTRSEEIVDAYEGQLLYDSTNMETEFLV